MASNSQAPLPSRVYEVVCCICLRYVPSEDADPPDSMLHLNCGHTWCKGCLNKTAMLSLRQRNKWSPFCCNTEGVDLDALRSSLDANVVDLLDRVRDELGCDDPVYCHVPKCSKFIPVDTGSTQGQYVRCPKCHEFTCVECKAGKDRHVKPGECPELITKEDKELAEQAGWKQCPNKRCQRLIERTQGCREMTCECGTVFCFECGHMMDEKDGCTCSRARNGLPEQLLPVEHGTPVEDWTASDAEVAEFLQWPGF